jgi:hypothetical protein
MPAPNKMGDDAVGLHFHHLSDADVRERMVHMWQGELDFLKAGYARQDWPYGKYLTAAGWAAFEAAMPAALAAHDDEWLAQQMRDPRWWIPKAPPRKGQSKWVDYDRDEAVRRLAITEFNLACVHGLASVLLDRGQSHCLVYRAGVAVEPRDAYCTYLEDEQVLLAQIMADHRRNYFPIKCPDARPIPSGPNCHHSIRAL